MSDSNKVFSFNFVTFAIDLRHNSLWTGSTTSDISLKISLTKFDIEFGFESSTSVFLYWNSNKFILFSNAFFNGIGPSFWIQSSGSVFSGITTISGKKPFFKRNYQRYIKTGRRVLPEYVRNVHRKVSEIVPEAIKNGIFDDFELYDMNKAGEAILVATFTKKDGLKILDNNLYGNFLAKAFQPDSLFEKWMDK